MRSRVPVALLLAASVLAGCSDDDEPGAAGTAAESSTTATEEPAEPTTAPSADADADASDAPPFPADVSADTTAASSDALVTVRDIRIGRHDGFDRVVFEVGGTGTPGWDVQYVEQASSQGSGDPVDVAGDAVLQVRITGAGYPFDTGVDEYSGPDPLEAAGTEVVREVVFDATYEGTTVAFVGTTARAPFRVYLLEDPGRVVVEVRDPG